MNRYDPDHERRHLERSKRLYNSGVTHPLLSFFERADGQVCAIVAMASTEAEWRELVALGIVDEHTAPIPMPSNAE